MTKATPIIALIAVAVIIAVIYFFFRSPKVKIPPCAEGYERCLWPVSTKCYSLNDCEHGVGKRR